MNDLYGRVLVIKHVSFFLFLVCVYLFRHDGLP